MLLSSFIEDPNHPQLLLCTLLSFCESYLTCPNSTSTLPSLRNGADRGTFLIIFANSSDATSNIQTAQRPLDANQLTATDCYGLLRYATVRYVTYFDPYFFGKRGMGTRHDLQLHVAPLLGFSERNLHMVPVK